jgi:hypothetical protein
MNETYTFVGTDPNWMVALTPIVPVIIVVSGLRLIEKKSKALPWLIALIVYFFGAAVIGVPMTWIYAGAFLGMGAVLLFEKSLGSWKIRLIFPAGLWAMAFVFIRIPAITDHSRQIVLQNSQVEIVGDWGSSTAPRHGLRITCVGPTKPPWDIRPWIGWSLVTGSGHAAEGRHLFAGYEYFWGPRGLIRGDALGEHLAKWANVVPSYQLPAPDQASRTQLALGPI